MLLNRTQEHVVWRTILEADEELASLRTVDSLAEMAAEAWRLVCSYEGQRRLRGWQGARIRGRFSGGRGRSNDFARQRVFWLRRSWKRRCAGRWSKRIVWSCRRVGLCWWGSMR